MKIIKIATAVVTIWLINFFIVGYYDLSVLWMIPSALLTPVVIFSQTKKMGEHWSLKVLISTLVITLVIILILYYLGLKLARLEFSWG